MAKFQIEYKHRIDFGEQVELDIRLASRPSKEDYQTILDAISKLDEVAKKYIKINAPPVVKKGTVK